MAPAGTPAVPVTCRSRVCPAPSRPARPPSAGAGVEHAHGVGGGVALAGRAPGTAQPMSASMPERDLARVGVRLAGLEVGRHQPGRRAAGVAALVEVAVGAALDEGALAAAARPRRSLLAALRRRVQAHLAAGGGERLLAGPVQLVAGQRGAQRRRAVRQRQQRGAAGAGLRRRRRVGVLVERDAAAHAGAAVDAGDADRRPAGLDRGHAGDAEPVTDLVQHDGAEVDLVGGGPGVGAEVAARRRSG